MRCHWVADKKIGRFWLPFCWGGIYGPEGCTCADHPEKETFAQFEKKIYNETVKKLKDELKEVTQMYFSQERIIRKLIKSKQQ